jgi:hypothetical protein
VTVLPGSLLAREAHGLNPGSGRIRMALVADVDECLEAATASSPTPKASEMSTEHARTATLIDLAWEGRASLSPASADPKIATRSNTSSPT